MTRGALTEENRKGSKMIKRRTFVLQKTFQELYAHTEAFKDKQLDVDTHYINQKHGQQVFMDE